MAYRGKYKPKNSSKYDGDPTKIVYRSLLERRFMVYCDTNSSILKWSSEEVVVPYVSPIDKRWHRYFVDFWIHYRNSNGTLQSSLIEVKPFSQTKEPKRLESGKKPTHRFLNEVMTWGVNCAKWTAATQYCEDRKWDFKILTEKDLT
jgi:hypothetical protein